MKNPLLYALGAALYIVVIVFILQTLSVVLKPQNGTFLIPMTMLSLFVLSAAIMGFFFLSEPLTLLVGNRKREAIVYFGKIVGFFACFLVVFLIILFFNSDLIPR